MEESEKEMDEASEVERRKIIREYLLGALGDPDKMREIEKKLLLSDEFAEILSVAEGDLIEEYLDDSLTAAERENFENNFLASPEKRQQLRMIENLRSIAAEKNTETVPVAEKRKSFHWKRFFYLSPSAWQFAVVLLLVLGIGFFIWRGFFYQSDIDKGLAELQMAYRDRRPVEARIAGFDYAPLNDTRGSGSNSSSGGGGGENPDSGSALQLKRAEGFLLHAAAENPSAESYQALGKFYLTEKKFDQAIEQFERAAAAASASPENADLQSDWGAALLELGKKERLKETDAASKAKSLEYLDQGLQHLEKAVSLNPGLAAAKFNRALALEMLYAPEQAKKAWREYLAIDADSRWADEARRHLQLLEARQPEDHSAAEVQQKFMSAFRQNNADEAWRALSGNRELIKEKYLPQRLAMSYLESDSGEEKAVFLKALQFAGDLEAKRIGDPFARDIARFYLNTTGKDSELLKTAQRAVKNGYQLCLKSKFGDALNEFKTAQEGFSQAGNIWEAKLSEYFICYCLINLDRTEEGKDKLREITEFSRKKNYKWLEATALYWLGGSAIKLKQYTKSKKYYEKALSIAEEVNDSYSKQRNLLALAILTSLVGQKNQTLGYLERVLEESNAEQVGLRQKFRNYDDALRILTAAGLFSAAKQIAAESVWLSDKIGDQMFQTQSRIIAATVSTENGDFAAAGAWLKEGEEKAESISDELTRKKMTAYAFLQTGYLEREAGNYEKSELFYDQAINLYEAMQLPTNMYAAQKGKLQTLMALGKNEELERQIPVMLKMTEDYRKEILAEQERTSFFDREESVYEIAVDYEYSRGRYEQAYNYAEISSSRSLLDWLQKGAKISGDSRNTEVLLEENAAPLSLADIRERMPGEVQILEYSVLDDKILIWLVSKEKFTVVPVKFSFVELQRKIENYLKSLRQNDDNSQAETEQLSRELYQLLIGPVYDELDVSREICIIPGKSLFYLPFAALLSPNNKFLLAEFNVIYAPSANIFLLCTEKAKAKAGFSNSETLLSVGNPKFDRQEFDDLPDLPTAEREAEEISVFYDKAHILPGYQATKRAFLDSIKDAEVIHFAGHYVVVYEEPLASYLLLAKSGSSPEDEILTNAELTAEKLPKTKLVLLSACQTGVESYYNGEGLIGLTRTFLAAGVPLVVASQWSVDTEATEALMKRFHYYRRQEKLPTASALRRAQMEMLNDQSGRFQKPYYWAAFAVFGGYSSF